MKIAIMQSNYIPWKGYFDMINMVDVFVIYDTVQYTKNDWRNRTLIVTKTGPQCLTIPVRVESLQQRINQTRVANAKWNRKHWNTLMANYAKADSFNLYRDKFEQLYASNDSLLLSEINLALIKLICGLLEIKTKIVRSEDFNLPGDRNQRLLELCNVLGADTYLSGPAARIYLDEARFEKSGIRVEWMSYDGYRVYNQDSAEFYHGVSIVDLLFNEGDEARKYLLTT